MRICPQCNQQETIETNNFCTNCGTSFPHTKATDNVEVPKSIELVSKFQFTLNERLKLSGICLILYIIISYFYLSDPSQSGLMYLIGIICPSIVIILMLKKHDIQKSQEKRIFPKSFEELSLDNRSRALHLAWETLLNEKQIPSLSQWNQSQVVKGALAAGFFFPAMISLSGSESLERNSPIGLIIWATMLSILPVVFLIAAMMRSRLKRVVNYTQDWSKYILNLDNYTYRNLAVIWVTNQYTKWFSSSLTTVKNRTLERFDITEKSGESFTLTSPTGESPIDMPPSELELITLVIGPFLAIRKGTVFDIKATSYSYAGSDKTIIIKEDTPIEKEFHFADIVTIDYERSNNSKSGKLQEGHLTLSLVNGTKFEFPTFEDSVQSAIEAVRKKTRSIKSV